MLLFFPNTYRIEGIGRSRVERRELAGSGEQDALHLDRLMVCIYVILSCNRDRDIVRAVVQQMFTLSINSS
jgi:hypothetical protein